jgi:hypothetical protein
VDAAIVIGRSFVGMLKDLGFKDIELKKIRIIGNLKLLSAKKM